jgi:hypothetical protein
MAGLLCGGIAPAQTGPDAAEPDLAKLLRANAYDLAETDGRLTGAGLDFLAKAAADAQFFGIGEQHNVRQIPEITGLLFEELRRRHGFNYLALEQDPLACRMASTPPARGSPEAVVGLAKKYPYAFTFRTDQELSLVARAGALSTTKADPVWGLDQAFGATHVLERLLEDAPNADARGRTLKLAEAARKVESVRLLTSRHYMADVDKPDDFWQLAELYRASPSPEARFLASQLVLSARVYQNYKRGAAGKVPGAFESGREREENMKDLFMREYRRAQSAGEERPRVLLKFGHTHMYRGRYLAYVPTLGNFVGEFAKSNGMKSFHLAMYLNNPPGGFGGVPKDSWLNVLAGVAPEGKWTVIDLRPLRDYWYAGKFKLPADLRETIFGFDAALLIGGGTRGTYELTAKRN